MKNLPKIFKEVKGLYKIIPLRQFRKTVGVSFDIIPMEIFPRIDGLDRVLHKGGAISPGSVGKIKRPWYMHPYQEDYLLVLQGTRYTEIYAPEHGNIERFEISPNCIKHNKKTIYRGPAILSWPCNVFHRIRSSSKEGSASVNIAVRHKRFNLRTNFSIYDVDLKNGNYNVIREGHLDQE